MKDIGRVHPEGRAADVSLAHAVLGKARQLLLRGLPREVGVRLRETGLRQTQQTRRASEGFSKEDHVWVRLVHLGDEPVPEIRRLGVWVVHTEGGNAQLYPVHDHAVDLLVDLLWRVIKVDGVDVLVLLRRVLGVRDGAVREHGEEFRVGFRPRVVGCGL